MKKSLGLMLVALLLLSTLSSLTPRVKAQTSASAPLVFLLPVKIGGASTTVVLEGEYLYFGSGDTLYKYNWKEGVVEKSITLSGSFAPEAPMTKARQIILVRDVLFVTTYGSALVWVIRKSDLSEIAQVGIRDKEGVWLDTDGENAYYGTTSGHVVGKVTPSGQRVWEQVLPYDSEGYAVHYWSGYLISTLEQADGFTVYDAASGRSLMNYSGDQPYYFITDVGDRAVLGGSGGKLLVLDRELNIVDTATVNGSIQDMVPYVLFGKYLLVTTSVDTYLLDAATLSIIDTFGKGGYALCAVYGVNKEYAFVALGGSEYLAIYKLFPNATFVKLGETSLEGTARWIDIDPSGGVIAVATTLATYIVYAVLPDPQSGNPRVRLWGIYQYNRFGHDLSVPIVLSTPRGEEWHAYFYGGTIIVDRLFTESIPTTLTSDTDILEGKLGVLLNRGLVKAVKTVEVAGYVDMDKATIEPCEDPKGKFDEEHTVIFERMHVVQALYGWNGHGFGGSTVGSAVVIDVSLSVPVSLYSEVKLHQSLVIVTVAPIFDWKSELLGVLGIPLVAGGASLAFAKYGAQTAAEKLLIWLRAQYPDIHSAILGHPDIWELTLDDFIKKVGGASGLAKTLGRAATIVGIALIADSLYGVYSKYVTYTSVRTVLIVAPIVEDADTKKKYSAVVFVLPTEEIQNYASEYETHVENLLKSLGVVDVGVTWISWGKNWDEYRALLEAGRLPTIDLKSAIETTIAAKYGIPSSRLRITGVKLIVETTVHGHVSLWQYITGGIKVPIVTLVSGASIQPRGTVAGGKVITDPSEIANILGNVTVNGVVYSFKAGSEGAVADFTIPEGSESLTIVFGKTGFFGNVKIEGTVVIKKDFTKLGDFGYEATLHYDWADTLIRLERIEFVDMEYPMIYAERSFIFKYGNFTHDITPAFVLNSTVEDPSSPSGYRYSYVTTKDTIYIDPANGGIMQPCKTYVFRYFYKQPPDVALFLYLNGTQVTSTKARHVTVVLNSTAEQDVEFIIIFRVKRLKGLAEETILEETNTSTIHVPANGTGYKTYLIEKYVDKAIQIMAEEGVPAFVEITARITNAPYDYIKENDEKTVIYYPPSTLVKLYGQPAKLQIYVYNAINGSAVAGATVKVYNETASYEQTTNSTGWATFDIRVGLWNIDVSKAGYRSYSTQLYVYSNMSFSVPLIPEGAQVPVVPPINNTNPPVIWNNESYWWLSVQVIWNDGMPFHGAIVTVKNLTDGSILFQQETNGTGFVHFLILNGTPIRVEVNATNPLNTTQIFYEYRELNMTHHTWLVFRLPWTSEYYEPEVMLTSLDVVIHRGQGYFFGNVSHLVMIGLWTNKPQTITLNVTLVNAETNQTIATKLMNITLPEGFTFNMTWLEINASRGMYIRAYANITSWEADTNLDNNELWSDTVFLKPFVDLHVLVIWKPVSQKIPEALLPEDVVELDIGLYTPINTTSLPAKLRYRIQNYDLKDKVWNVTSDVVEEIRAGEPGIVWRNMTLTLPWSNVVNIFVNASHDWEDMFFNNYINITINIDPDVKLLKVEIKEGIGGIVREGTPFTLVFHIKSNIPEELGARGFISAYDNETQTLVGRIGILLKPEATYKLSAQAPENPKVLWELRTPYTTHVMTAMFAGYDLYEANNSYEFKIRVYSYQLLWLIIIVIVVIVIVAAVRAATHTIVEEARRRYRFVKRRGSRLGSALHSVEERREERRFVRRKE